MGTPFDPSILLPGDCLLYGPRGWVGWLIAIKTWHRIAHVEIYEGDGFSVASRDGLGVNRYRLRTSELIRVLRPRVQPDVAAATVWFEKVARGQKYDFDALIKFLWPSEGKPDKDPDRQICSALGVRWYEHAGVDAFSDREDADLIAPFQFDVSPAFTEVWRA
jgi:hypothetical protein